MSYRSEVKICTTINGFEKMKGFIDDNLNLSKDQNLLEVLDEKIESIDEDYIIFGWDSIKWYEGSCKDVTAVMKALSYIEGLDIPYRYARIGENSDDIEIYEYEDEYGLPEFNVDVILSYNIPDQAIKHYALFYCDEWKSYSSMRLQGVFTRYELNKQIHKRISANDMKFEVDDEVDIFNNTLSVDEINVKLKYGFIQQLSINEEL